MSDKAENFWQTHLASTSSPLIHFASTSLLDVESISRASGKIGFAHFVVDASEIKSEPSLMDIFAASMNLPSYFGRNWDALLDLMRDLSWTKAEGYVLVISRGDNLPSLPNKVFSSLISVLEATIRDWRDERGEFGERTRPVAFHVIFSGGELLKESLLGELREPLCEHLKGFSVSISPPGGRFRKTPTYRDAENLVSTGADPETILLFLREHGMDERDSMYCIAGLMGTTVTEAKSLIYNSQTWSEVRIRDEQFREVAKAALRDFGWKDDGEG